MKNKNKTSRLEECFRNLKQRGEKALVTFVTAGDPSRKSSKEVLDSIVSNGVDIIELGIPFSDPMADGPTIQASSERALKKGANVDTVLGLALGIRKKSETPIVLFGYYNPVFSYGVKRFARAAKRAGTDGVLIVDLPPEESHELKVELDKVGIDLIYLLTPTSDASRIKAVTAKASGFIYYVSLAGVTGARRSLGTDVASAVKRIKRSTKIPIVVGFGISTEAQARKVSSYADGVVVGSAIVNLIEKNTGKKKLPKTVGNFVRKLKRGTRRT
jgi:tryptophan synthase alpha chain